MTSIGGIRGECSLERQLHGLLLGSSALAEQSSTGRAVRRIENGIPKLQATAEKLERQLLNP